MWPINLLITHCPGNKLKKFLQFLKAEMITSKIHISLISLGQGVHFYSACFKCVQFCWWHICSSVAKLPIILIHSCLWITGIIWVMDTLSSAMVWWLFTYMLPFKKFQRWNSGGSARVNAEITTVRGGETVTFTKEGYIMVLNRSWGALGRLCDYSQDVLQFK